jgi:predicted CXXCH cytochrome family protein
MGDRRSACNGWHNAPRGVTFLIVMFFLAALPLLLPAQTKNSCLDCHFALEPPLLVTPEQFAQDIHAQKGLNCASCHGGDPTNEDPAIAMGRAAGFRGKIQRAQIPALCAKCHSDAAYMRQYNPSVRTDQFTQYQTSVHGKRLRQGDTKVAVCTDCHGVHELRPATDARSKVHALNVAQTCAACHSKPEHMRGYSIPTDQFAGYSASVHHEALTVRGDLSAPTCTTCHGTHGAAPPGVASVEFVCATCHVFQAQLFDSSKHKPAFAAMGIRACVTCHSNHRIERPTDAMIGISKEAVCLNCHSSGDPGYEGADKMHQSLQTLVTAVARSDEVLGRAERSGMEISQAKLEQAQARDALTKARVTIHSFDPKRVEADILEGLKVTEKTRQAGVAALEERDYRRIGLGVSLLTIVAVLIGLRLYIRKIEAANHSGAQV